MPKFSYGILIFCNAADCRANNLRFGATGRRKTRSCGISFPAMAESKVCACVFVRMLRDANMDDITDYAFD